jgi:hypothetical protein
MVHLRTVPNAFHAQVIAARLGADGIVTQLKGADAIYPVGEVAIFVAEEDFEAARELLLADEVESAFVAGTDRPGHRILGRRRLLAAVVIALLVVLVTLQVLHGA